MSIEEKTTLFLITGFLGSGKTTLLNNLIALYKDTKIGILQNEYGTISIDGILLRNQESIEIMEVNDGSVFCVCKKGEFIDALIKMASLQLETIFIEASGISDPSNFIRDLEFINQKTQFKLNYRGNICLVDAENVLDLIESMIVIESQIKYADWIVLNKIDLVTKNSILKIIDKIKSINSHVDIIETTYSKLPPHILNKDPITLNRPEPILSQNTLENRLLKITLHQNSSMELDKVKEFFYNICHETIRIKGFFYDLNKISYYVSGVNGNFNIKEIKLQNIEYKINIIFKKEVADFKILELLEKNWEGLA